MKNDPEEALKYYLPALADTSDGNGILKRELLEVIPICLSKIGDNIQGTALQNFTRLEKPVPTVQTVPTTANKGSGLIKHWSIYKSVYPIRLIMTRRHQFTIA